VWLPPTLREPNAPVHANTPWRKDSLTERKHRRTLAERARWYNEREGDMKRVSIVGCLLLGALVASPMSAAVADPVNSPRVSGTGTLVCGDVTYTIVSPPGPTPAGQMVTANGSDSTQVQIMILDKAARFPQDMLTECMFTSPEVFVVSLLITPVH
jgi:hypothetical protein